MSEEVKKWLILNGVGKEKVALSEREYAVAYTRYLRLKKMGA